MSGTALFEVQAPSFRRGPLTERQQVVDPDAAAVAAAQNDPAAFVELYDRYVPHVHRYVTLRVRDATTAEDVTSHVFLTALSRLDSFRARGSFSAWIFRIAQNAVYDHYRRRRPLESLEKAHELADPDPDPEERALALESAKDLWREVTSLRPDQQHLLALRYGAGLDFDEIAAIVGKKPTATRVAVHRALVELRKRYTR